MKTCILLVILSLAAVSFSFADEPRTVGVYKRHMSSEDHSASDFDHTLHHLLYLSGVSDGYTVLNKQRIAKQEAPLYCQPEVVTLSGADYLQILDRKLYHPESPVSDHLTVAEAMLLALQDAFPCQ